MVCNLHLGLARRGGRPAPPSSPSPVPCAASASSRWLAAAPPVSPPRGGPCGGCCHLAVVWLAGVVLGPACGVQGAC